jgi:uncharacterized membrane protein
MDTLWMASANSLHALATVVLIGHYLLLGVLYLPVLGREMPDRAGLRALSEISRRSRPWLYAALAAFAVTGVYLTFVDPFYLGLGNFGNPWGVLMLIKHVLILGMIAAGFWFNAVLRVGPLLASNAPAATTVAGFRRYVWLMSGLGLVIVLITAAAQAL